METRKAYVKVLYYKFDGDFQISGLEVFRKNFTSIKEAVRWCYYHPFPIDWRIDEIDIRMV